MADGAWMARDAQELARPDTCAARGVAAPFTAPALHGVRLRAAPKGGIEVIIPNPSGREGWFVLPWAAALERFRPSLADRALIEALGQEPVTPAGLRAAASRVAAGGLAGRAARRAAEALALRGPPTPVARLALLESFLAEVALMLRACPPSGPEQRLGEALRAQGLSVLGAAAAQSADDALGAERRDWLLDGWELLAAGWRVAPLEERPALLRRAAALAPPVPLEAEGWPGGAALAAAGSPRGGSVGGSIAQEVAEAAFARWLGG
jgi:hypothetical protein